VIFLDYIENARYILAVFNGNLTAAAKFASQSQSNGSSGAKDYRRTFKRALKGEGITDREQKRINNAFNRRVRKVEGINKTNWDEKRATADKDYGGRMVAEAKEYDGTQEQMIQSIKDAQRLQAAFQRNGIPYRATVRDDYHYDRADGVSFDMSFYGKCSNPTNLFIDCIAEAELNAFNSRQSWESGAGNDSGQGAVGYPTKRTVRVYAIRV